MFISPNFELIFIHTMVLYKHEAMVFILGNDSCILIEMKYKTARVVYIAWQVYFAWCGCTTLKTV